MTTVPGFNLLIQQSGIVRDMNQSSSTPNPDPGQAAAEQAAGEQAKKTTIQETEETEKLKAKKEKDQDKKNQIRDKRKKKKKEQDEEDNPDSTGRLLDTIV